MSELLLATVAFEPIEIIDNETVELNIKYENLSVHGIQTLKCLDTMRKERQLCDVILTVEGHELFAHRALLCCHSNYFLELFSHDEIDTSTKKQIYYQIDDVEYTALKSLIQFIYQGSFHLSSDLIPKIYSAAHQLRIETIFRACSNYFIEQLNEQNCLSTRLLAIDDDLRTKSTDYIKNHFYNVLNTREFNFLPSIKIELINSIIDHSNIVCENVFNWIIQQCQKDNYSLQELCQYTHLLYSCENRTLHDCVDMDEKHSLFTDTIKNYQSYKLSKRNLTSTNSLNENTLLETTLIHVGQSTEHILIAVAIIKGKMTSITIHMSSSLSIINVETSENHDQCHVDSKADENCLTNVFSSNGTHEKGTSLASLSTARCGFGVVSTDDSIFVVGGYDRGDCLDTIEQYDPNKNKWTLLAIPMNSRRGRVSAALLKHKIYVCGGSDGQQELDTCDCLDLRTMDKWMSIKELPTPVAHAGMCTDDSFIYLIGGCEGDRCMNDCYRYDPKTNTWLALSPMTYERSQATVLYFNGKIYVFGGCTSNRCLSSCEILSLSTNTWSHGPSMRENRRGAGAVLYDNKILVIGGSNGVTSLTSMEIFDPTTNELIITLNGFQTELNIPRVGVGAVQCQEKLYVIGGFDGRNFLRSIEIYDEHVQRWKLNHTKYFKLEKCSNLSS